MFSSQQSQVESNVLVNYIENVFSTYLYTGTGATQTITNGIDLSTKGGLVWIKNRSGVTGHRFTDTARGVTKSLESNSVAAEATEATGLTAFNGTGFTIGADADYNTSSSTYVAWTFEEQANFFDVVTYTGTGTNRTIAHNLGSIPGCIIVKRTDTTGNWQVYHNSLSSATNSIQLNLSNAQASAPTVWNSTAPTNSVFSVGTDTTVNASGGTYVAYIFAHNAGGFGLTGTDNVISCGSFYAVQSGSDVPVNLGFEPQFVLLKNIDASDDWRMYDSMRGMPISPESLLLRPNQSAAEFINAPAQCYATSTGFVWAASTGLGATGNQIYIAIRKGPMKIPTTGTSVFGFNARTGTGVNATVTGSAGVSDAMLIKNRGAAVADLFASRLTGTGYLVTSTTAAEVAAGITILQANPWDVMDGVKVGTTSTITNASANTYINYLFDRAPGFMDVVCYTGTGSATTQTHNLGAVPEFIIVKRRNTINAWAVYANNNNTNYLVLNTTAATVNSGAFWNNTSPTNTVFTVGTNAAVNALASTYVAYLFATCPGVSKVGSYTGTGTTLQIDCGFTGGSRFILIKRIDSTGSWYYWDSARGIVAGNDPYSLLNSAAAEVTSTDYVDPISSGFEISSTAPAEINAVGGTYIFLAIA